MKKRVSFQSGPFGIQRQQWFSQLLLFSICWVRPDAKNPSREVLVEKLIYEGDVAWSPVTLDWRVLKDASFLSVLYHCDDLARRAPVGEFTAFDLRTADGHLDREIFLAGLHERGIKIPEELENE